MLIRHAIGAVLRRRRLQLGKTLRQLAEESRVSLPYLSEIERGRKEASSEILATVCGVLDLSLTAFLAEVGGEFASVGGSVIELRSSIDTPTEFSGRSDSHPAAMLRAA
ncbi:helix-turn-helix domain-containing protein [Glaciibacter superstes]|uniref:helix-turn-helix domain-containing protein n=1 Tax=Glaciibacter superstes TaxID=501023 RepID=UPI0003B42B5B|nr:helix-turn-helix transcriptional regulator [Glaciibacter superstes]